MYDRRDYRIASDLPHCRQNGEEGAPGFFEKVLQQVFSEEAKSQVRWLRPEYQLKGQAQAQGQGKQAKLAVDDAPAPAPGLRPWPDELPAQAAALSAVLGTLSTPASVEDIAGHFEGKKTKKRLEEVTKLLETLEALGRAVEREGGWVSSG